jgi:two-component system response regulator HydG
MPSRSRSRILVVDDHVEMARLLADQLGDSGYAVELAQGGREALAAIRARPFDLVLTDLRMDEVDGFDVLEAALAEDPLVPVVLMTAFGAIESAIEAMKRGAYHYATKPFRFEEVELTIRRALDERRLREENATLRERDRAVDGTTGIVGSGAALRAMLELVDRVAPSPAPVLVRGESGTGKELVARALHERGPRREGSFVPVNCTALPETLLESELFGHVKGAYTGASGARRGLFVEADGGTLFLDEIGDMAPSLQAKLLRVLEDGEIRPIGADVSRRVDVRIVAATHQDLEARVEAGAFRSDLFYRLNVVPIVVPPLRDRTEDVPALVDHFLARARRRNPGTRVVRFAPELVRALARHRWPGNVRELENVVERLVIVSAAEEATLEDVERFAPTVVAEDGPLERAKQRMPPLRELESEYIAWVVARCGGNKTRAAEILGIDVSTIHRRERERSA